MGYSKNRDKSFPKYRAGSLSESRSRSPKQFLRFRYSSRYRDHQRYDGENSLTRKGHRDESRATDKPYKPSYYSSLRCEVSRYRADSNKRSVYRESGDYSPSWARPSHLMLVSDGFLAMLLSQARQKHRTFDVRPSQKSTSQKQGQSCSGRGRGYQDVPDYYIQELTWSEPFQIFSDALQTFVESAGPGNSGFNMPSLVTLPFQELVAFYSGRSAWPMPRDVP